MLPARRGPDAFAVIKVLHPGICYYQRQCNMMFYGKCYVNTLSNSDKSQQLVCPSAEQHRGLLRADVMREYNGLN